jgi:predicted dehydrogenase
VGVIGVGHLGEYHVQKYRALPNTNLIGVVDINQDRAQEIARRYETQHFEKHSDLLTEVDAVSLVVPTELHFDEAKEVLSRGVHLLIEKPITYTIEPADILIDMAEERGLVLQVGLVERFNPAIVQMEALLNGPVFLESHRMNPFTERGTDVDVVLDLMIHDLDIILHVVKSEVKELHAVGLSVVTKTTDIANVRLIFENGTVGNLTASRVADKPLRKIRVFQPDAYLSANCLKRELIVTRLDGKVDPGTGRIPTVSANKTFFPNSDPLADEIASFVDSVLMGSQPIVSGRDGRRALKYALGIIEQIEHGCCQFQKIC